MSRHARSTWNIDRIDVAFVALGLVAVAGVWVGAWLLTT